MDAGNLNVIIGIAASVFTSLALLPQLVKIVKEKKSEGTSPVMLIVLLIGLTLWTIYGFMEKDRIIIVANIVALAINLTVVILRSWYIRHPGKA